MDDLMYWSCKWKYVRKTLDNIYLLLLLLLSHFSPVTLCDPIDGSPNRLCRPCDSPGKNTGVGCHFLLQCMKVKSESEVTQSCLTLCNPMDCSPPGSSAHGIFQARVLEWGAIAFSGREVSPCQSGVTGWSGFMGANRKYYIKSWLHS